MEIPCIMDAAPKTLTADDTFIAVYRDGAVFVFHDSNISLVAGTLGNAEIAPDAMLIGKDFTFCHNFPSSP
jgi:hypothetical protein